MDIRGRIERVPAAVKAVKAVSAELASPILDGLVKAAEELEAMPAG